MPERAASGDLAVSGETSAPSGCAVAIFAGGTVGASARSSGDGFGTVIVTAASMRRTLSVLGGGLRQASSSSASDTPASAGIDA